MEQSNLTIEMPYFLSNFFHKYYYRTLLHKSQNETTKYTKENVNISQVLDYLSPFQKAKFMIYLNIFYTLYTYI